MQSHALSMLSRIAGPLQQRAVSAVPVVLSHSSRFWIPNQRRTRRMSSAAAVMHKTTVSFGHEDLVAALREVVPKMDSSSYKGQSGKVGVMGGCREYTGAPYFSAMSALRMGADLAYVICTPDAATVIKSYSPELIVLPALYTKQDYDNAITEKFVCPREHILARRFEDEISKWIQRMNVLIIGPGLGDDLQVGNCMHTAVEAAIGENVPIIIDGSGINFLVEKDRQDLFDLICGYSNCLLTPNIAEFGRLAQRVEMELPGSIGTHWQQHAEELAAALDGPILLSKGPQDVVSNGKITLKVTADGSPRRCGGQGDILTGTTAAFTSWTLAHLRKQQQQQQNAQQKQSNASRVLADVPPLMVAAYGGCLAMRAAAVAAFEDMGRSMVAGDMIDYLGDEALEAAGLLLPDNGDDGDSARAASRL